MIIFVNDFCWMVNSNKATCTITHTSWRLYGPIQSPTILVSTLGFSLRVPLPMNLGRDYKTWVSDNWTEHLVVTPTIMYLGTF
jgi:hypothetical protein